MSTAERAGENKKLADVLSRRLKEVFTGREKQIRCGRCGSGPWPIILVPEVGIELGGKSVTWLDLHYLMTHWGEDPEKDAQLKELLSPLAAGDQDT